MNKEIEELNKKAQAYAKILGNLQTEVQKVIVGQHDVLRKMLICLIADGHVLVEGVPGLAKTLMIKSLSQSLGLSFQRIQFTPDLLPADIVGTRIYNHKTASFTTKTGPIFANFILADEINRAPPKVQSALLEAMQERQVTIGDESYKLDLPFLVLATQNPLETEGTYRLPEAQVDRFMFKVLIDYPDKKEEKEIINRMTSGAVFLVSEVIGKSKIIELQKFVPRIYVDDKIKDYITDIVFATRKPEDYGLDINGMIDYGASPRASIWLTMAAKANALLNERGYVLPEDVKEIAFEVLRHRILISYEAEAEGLTSDDIIKQILDKIKVP